MRALIIRFLDCEGPGLIAPIMQQKGYSLTYHDAYLQQQLIPQTHQLFDTLVLMGGPQSVAKDKPEGFFKPYFHLVEDFLAMPDKKVIGICLGSQILAKALGGQVTVGKNGEEVGFSRVHLEHLDSPVWSGFQEKSILTFHLHSDTFSLPGSCRRLLKGDMYENQMFCYENRAFAIQCHFEVSYPMLETWWTVHQSIPEKLGSLNETWKDKNSQVQEAGKKLFHNLL